MTCVVLHCPVAESIALNKLPLLAKRYLPLQLLGKGGFSEVWKVVDLQEGKYAAAKIHRMLETWSNAELEHFVKHITREYAVQRVRANSFTSSLL